METFLRLMRWYYARTEGSVSVWDYTASRWCRLVIKLSDCMRRRGFSPCSDASTNVPQRRRMRWAQTTRFKHFISGHSRRILARHERNRNGKDLRRGRTLRTTLKACGFPPSPPSPLLREVYNKRHMPQTSFRACRIRLIRQAHQLVIFIKALFIAKDDRRS